MNDENKLITLGTLSYFKDKVDNEINEKTNVIKSAEGAAISLSDSSDEPLRSLTVYGRSTQDGTPSPEAPVDILSVGDGKSVTVTISDDTDTQTAAVTTGLPLRAIPVAGSGNLTVDGKQYIADTLEVNADGTGKIVKRIGVTIYDPAVNIATFEDYGDIPRIAISNVAPDGDRTLMFGMSTAFAYDNRAASQQGYIDNTFCYSKNGAWVYVRASGYTSVEDFIEAITAAPPTFLYILAQPQEISLTPQETAALLTLHSYNPISNISNDEGAYQAVEYICNSDIAIDVARMIANTNDGKDGVSVASITQTTTSTADGGTNVITAKLSNGTTTTFDIRNGTKGSTGATGATPTIKAAAGSNIATVGTPSVTASTSGTTTTFTFNNLKGEKGDTGTNATTTAVATASVNGLMSATDKAKLDDLDADSYAVKKTLTSEDLDSVTTQGFYNAGGGNTCTNKPSGVDNFGMEVIKYAGGQYLIQIMYSDNSTIPYRRACSNGTWGVWRRNDDLGAWASVDFLTKALTSPSGFGTANNTVTNMPWTGYWMFEITRTSNNYIVARATEYGSTKAYIRTYHGGNAAWTTEWRPENGQVVGTEVASATNCPSVCWYGQYTTV